jgi:hypothetical protein
VVAQAKVKELSDGKAVLIIPATQVTMAVRTELDAAPAEPKETETVITGVDRAGAENDTAAQDAATAEAVSQVTEAPVAQQVETTGAPEAVVPVESESTTVETSNESQS